MAQYSGRRKRKPIYDEDSGVPPTQDQIDKMVKQAHNVMNYWLEQNLQTRATLYKKVKSKGIPDDIIEAVLDKYEEADLIDDVRYANYFVSFKIKYDRLSKYSLSQKLREKGVSREIIEEVLSNVDEDELEENARTLVQRKLVASRKYEPYKRVKSLADMLIRKGYGAGQAFRIVKEIIQEEEEDFEIPSAEDLGFE